jgi:tetratricopeptide (TPR) repeat protein
MFGQWVLEVEGLPYPQVEGPSLGKGYAAVDLFVQGARRVQAGFKISHETGAWILRICRRVEGLPLALEIAAAWTRTYSVEQVAAEIERSLDFLSGAYRDLPERQRSLRAVFEHTWGMLNDAERTVFQRLSVFRGSFSPAAALFAARASPLELAGLVDKSLLHRTVSDRYSAHEVVRVYGVEKAAEAPEDRREVQARFRSYYTEMLAQRATDLTGPRQAEAVAELGLEAENLRSAWSAALELDDFGMLERSADGLFRFYMIRGRYQEGADAFGGAVARFEETEPGPQASRLLGKALVRSGAFLTELSQYERAKTNLDRSRSLLAAGDDPEELAFCLNRIGILARKTGALSEARAMHTESHALARQFGFLREVADSLSGLGTVSYFLGEYEAAGESYREALEVFQSVGDQQGAGRCLLNLANIADRQGAYEESRELLVRSLSLSEEIGDRWGVAAALNNMGNIALKLGEDREARRLYEESLAIKRQLGNQEGISSSLDNLGRVAFRLSEMTEAKLLREASLAIRREIGDAWGVAYSLTGLGDIAAAQGNIGDAGTLYREALRTAIAIQAPTLVGAALIGWAELLWKQGEREQSLEIAAWIAQGTAKDKDVQDRAVRLREAIAPGVPQAALRRAEERIRSRSLEDMVAAVLGEESPPALPPQR